MVTIHTIMSTASAYLGRVIGRERVDSWVKTLLGAKPAFFFREKRLPYSPKEGLCFPPCAARSGEVVDEKCTGLKRELDFQLTMLKNLSLSVTFSRRGRQNVHDTVARA